MSEMELAENITDEPTTDAEAGAEGEQPSAAVDAETPATETPVEQPAAPAWTPEQVYEQAEQRAAAVAEARFQALLEEATAYSQQQPQEQGLEQQVEEFDFFADDAGAKLNALIATSQQQTVAQVVQAMQGMLAPIQQSYQQQREQEGTEGLKDLLADVGSREGELLSQAEGGEQAVHMLAKVLVNESIRKYGETNHAAEDAVTRSYKMVRSIEQAAEKRGYARAESEFGGLAGARREPAGAGSGAVVPLDSFGNENDFTDAFLAKHGVS